MLLCLETEINYNAIIPLEPPSISNTLASITFPTHTHMDMSTKSWSRIADPR